MLIQFGTGGMAWLLFIVGLLWCAFAWWRASRCRSSLICVISAITSMISLIAIIGILLYEIFINRGSGGSSHMRMIEYLALALLILAGVSWIISSLCFLIAAGRSTYTNPQDLVKALTTPPQA